MKPEAIEEVWPEISLEQWQKAGKVQKSQLLHEMIGQRMRLPLWIMHLGDNNRRVLTLQGHNRKTKKRDGAANSNR